MSYKVTNPIRFPGQYDDSDTKDIRSLIINNANGVYYNWNRWYNPDVGRYVEVDRLIYELIDCNKESFNSYNYSGINPIIYFDPEGLYVISNKCSNIKRKKIREAIDDLKDSLRMCKSLNFNREIIIKNINQSTVLIRCVNSFWCGCAYNLRHYLDYYPYQILLCDNAFEEGSKCYGCLSGQIAHEVVEISGYDHNSALCIQKYCFSCSIIEKSCGCEWLKK